MYLSKPILPSLSTPPNVLLQPWIISLHIAAVPAYCWLSTSPFSPQTSRILANCSTQSGDSQSCHVWIPRALLIWHRLRTHWTTFVRSVESMQFTRKIPVCDCEQPDGVFDALKPTSWEAWKQRLLFNSRLVAFYFSIPRFYGRDALPVWWELTILCDQRFQRSPDLRNTLEAFGLQWRSSGTFWWNYHEFECQQ